MKSQREYIQASSRCPCCDSSDVKGGAVDIDSAGAWQPVDCAACGFAWVDNYRLIGYAYETETEPAPSFDSPLRGKPKVDALEAPPLAEQLTRHLSEQEIKARAALAEGLTPLMARPLADKGKE